ncbi:MAG: hypothetical protein KatS3mg057_0389 [Herpetosiphonaceae bacterium]|nr:MAG: hypothetical protein KatS3mg057_0389 [Herpetosiphonaceae bacterium]
MLHCIRLGAHRLYSLVGCAMPLSHSVSSAACTFARIKLPMLSTRGWRLRPWIFSPIVAALSASFHGFHTLAIEDNQTRFGISTDIRADLLTQLVIDPF